MVIDWLLILIMPLDFISTDPLGINGLSAACRHNKNGIYIDWGINDGFIWVVNFNTAFRLDVRLPTRHKWSMPPAVTHRIRWLSILRLFRPQ